VNSHAPYPAGGLRSRALRSAARGSDEDRRRSVRGDGDRGAVLLGTGWSARALMPQEHPSSGPAGPPAIETGRQAFAYPSSRALTYALDERTPWLLRSRAWASNRSRRRSSPHWRLWSSSSPSSGAAAA